MTTNMMKTLTTFVLAAATASCVHAKYTPLRRDATSPTPFNWTTLPSSTNLTRTSCYDSFQCAKLTVPLQYADPSAGNASIALVISPSNYSTDDPSYRGPLLLNPGGPGEPGTTFVLGIAPYLRHLVGPGYDLVGFDPRGLGFSTPSLELVSDPAEALAYFGTYPSDVNAEPDALARAYALTGVYNGIAQQKLNGGDKTWESVGTAAVATDMLAIAKAFGSDEVNYWGFSYGTTLGATFAAMFPNNTGRIILDGVMNVKEYYAGEDRSSLLRTSDALNSFYTGCVAAGPSHCALATPNSTASSIRTRVENLLNAAKLIPLAVSPDPNRNVTVGGVVDYTTITSTFFIVLYSPFAHGSAFASVLLALEQGDPAPMLVFSQTIGATITQLLATCDIVPNGQAFQLNATDTRMPIACGDSAGRAKRDLNATKAEYEILKAQSDIFAGTWWPGLPGPCTTWNITAKDQFNASFETTTKNPLLFVSNTFDPVTPIQSARNMSSGFAGSVVLEQNSTGHSSLSGFSTCTASFIQAYFANGTLPPNNTLCQTDTQMFVDPSNSSGDGGISFPSRRAVFDQREFEDAVRGLREEGIKTMVRSAPGAMLKRAKMGLGL